MQLAVEFAIHSGIPIESDIQYELILVIWYTIQTIELEIAFFYKFSLKDIRRDLVIPVILQKVR